MMKIGTNHAGRQILASGMILDQNVETIYI